MRAVLHLRPAGRIEEIASGEREDIAGKAVGRAEAVRRPAVEVLLPEIAAPLRQQESRRLLPGLAPARVAGPVGHHLRGDHRSRRSPHELPERIRDVRPHRLEQRLLLPARGCERVRDEQDPRLAHQQRGSGSLADILEVRLGPVVLDQPDGDAAPTRGRGRRGRRARARAAPRSPPRRRDRATTPPAAARRPGHADARATARPRRTRSPSRRRSSTIAARARSSSQGRSVSGSWLAGS